MIDYSPFFKTLKNKKTTAYRLIKEHNVSSATIDTLKHNRPVTTTTLDRLCNILDCDLADIICYKKK